MRSMLFTGASALILLVTSVQAKHGVHEHLEAIHRRHRHEREVARQVNETLVKRGTCTFPANAGLIPVTPGSSNGGWAFAPDQFCTTGRYCPYACPPGQVSMQWDPSVTSYVYPGSRNGGLLCNSDGTLSKPYPDRPYCQSTSANIGVENACGGQNVAFCQTVLPGDEDMLIPTDVTAWSKLAVPDPTYWANTAAHYYINPPGISSSQGCVWGSTANPYGNWAPYVAGANADASGEVFIKLGWNPVYLEQATPFRNTMPNWGVRIECPSGGCNGLPCAIDPSKNQVNEMIGSASDGAGGGAFCVVTVQKGGKANFVVFSAGGDSPASSSSSSVSSSSTTSTATATNSTSSSGWSNLKQGGQFYQSNASPTLTASNSTASDSSLLASNTTSEITGPTGKPDHGLFNDAAPAGPTAAVSDLPKATGPVHAKSTGAASLMEMSFAVIMLGFGAMLL